MLIEDLNAFRNKIIKQFNKRNIKFLAKKYNLAEPVISFIIASAGVDTKKYVKVKRC